MSATVSLISAMSENRVIGNQGKIPWHIRKDLKRFWQRTKDHVVIMGRKTFASTLNYYQKSENPFPQRTFIIITRDQNYQVQQKDCFVAHSIKAALDLAQKKEKEEIFVSGGAQIYQQTINKADKLYLTIVKGNFTGDAFFPKYSGFKVIADSGWQKEGKNQYKFVDLEKF